MPLQTAALKTGLLQLFTDMRTREEVSDEEYAERFAELIEAFVKTGDGTYQVGTLKAGNTVVTAAPATIVKIT
jgi:hypothetical protein